MSSSPAQAPDKPLRIALFSTAHMHARSYAAALAAHPGAEIAGVCDDDAARGEAFAQEHGSRYYADPAALLATGVDGVIVASENARHRRWTELAAGGGARAVLCEKPLAATLEDARAMIALCAERGVALATAFPCRYSPVFRRLREQVRSGAVGDVLAIRGTNHGRMPGGWFTDTALSGGGAVIDHTVHVADLNAWLLGEQASEVYAEIGSGFYREPWDDTGFLTMTYPGGVFATLDTSWSRPATFPTWGDVTLQVVGTGGVLDADLFAQALAVYDARSGQVAWPGWGSDADAGLVGDFLNLAAGRAAPDLATGQDGYRALAVALAAYRSAEQGAPVMVNS